MATLDLQAIRKRLEEERASLIGDIDSLQIENENQETDYGASNHPGDDATEVFLRERNLTLRENSGDMLEQVDAALERLDNGTYGICQRCGKEINPERLEALPSAAYCITCQSEIEREAR